MQVSAFWLFHILLILNASISEKLKQLINCERAIFFNECNKLPLFRLKNRSLAYFLGINTVKRFIFYNLLRSAVYGKKGIRLCSHLTFLHLVWFDFLHFVYYLLTYVCISNWYKSYATILVLQLFIFFSIQFPTFKYTPGNPFKSVESAYASHYKAESGK